jgi:hypothetical protein
MEYLVNLLSYIGHSDTSVTDRRSRLWRISPEFAIDTIDERRSLFSSIPKLPQSFHAYYPMRPLSTLRRGTWMTLPCRSLYS